MWLLDARRAYPAPQATAPTPPYKPLIPSLLTMAARAALTDRPCNCMTDGRMFRSLHQAWHSAACSAQTLAGTYPLARMPQGLHSGLHRVNWKHSHMLGNACSCPCQHMLPEQASSACLLTQRYVQYDNDGSLAPCRMPVGPLQSHLCHLYWLPVHSIDVAEESDLGTQTSYRPLTPVNKALCRTVWSCRLTLPVKAARASTRGQICRPVSNKLLVL